MSTSENTLSPEAVARIDRACDRFEAAWKAGAGPRIEDYLGDAADLERAALLEQLLLLDLDYRTRQGQTPDVAEYCARFPDLAAQVRDIFGNRGAGDARSPAFSKSRASPHPEPAPDSAASSTGSTSSGLLARVRASQPDAWVRLVELYTPFLYGCCRRARLSADDAADVVQEVLSSVSRSLGDFRDTGRTGSFRAWLRGITRHRLLDHFRCRAQQPQTPGGTDAQVAWQDLPDPGVASEAEPARPVAPDPFGGEKGLQVTRFKGLGEMNAEELRETTLDPAQRTLIQGSMRDAGAAAHMFPVLMGDRVEPRREFIEKHSLEVRNLDV
jgi:RNA polymerase sigma factor (sigma-70 family)